MNFNRKIYRSVIVVVLLVSGMCVYLANSIMNKVMVRDLSYSCDTDSWSLSCRPEYTTVQPDDDLTRPREHPGYTVDKIGKGDVEHVNDKDAHTYDASKLLNLLFIAVDDLRPQFGADESEDRIASFDKHRMFTPHIDELSKKSLVLTRAYTQYSLCGPSRASLMTSRRPDVTKVYGNTVYWRDVGGNFTSLPQYFREHGYRTAGTGKVYHIGVEGKMWSLDNQDNKYSWSEPYMYSHVENFKYRTHDCNWFMTPDNDTLTDDVTAHNGIEMLNEFGKDPSRPFFMAVGFQKPHISHACPERFFKHYMMEVGQFMYNKSWQQPPYNPNVDMVQFLEGISNDELGYIPRQTLKEIRRAYFACVSYIDFLIHKLINTLKDNDLLKSTAIVITSDHGYHLGDNNQYGKYSNHEIANRVPLIIHIPGRTDHGVTSRSLTELVDLFPSLVEAVGLPPIPSCPRQSRDVRLCTDGVSLLPLIDKPERNLKHFAFSQVQRGQMVREYSIRNTHFRFISSIVLDNGEYPCHGESRWRERTDRLFDLNLDPVEAHDVVNVPRYQNVTTRLRKKLQTSIYVHNCDI